MSTETKKVRDGAVEAAAAAAGEEVPVAPRNGSEEDNVQAPAPTAAFPVVSKTVLDIVDELKKNPAISDVLQTLMSQSPTVLATLLHDQVPVFAKDATSARLNLLEKVQQTGEHIKVLVEHEHCSEEIKSNEKESLVAGAPAPRSGNDDDDDDDIPAPHEAPLASSASLAIVDKRESRGTFILRNVLMNLEPEELANFLLDDAPIFAEDSAARQLQIVDLLQQTARAAKAIVKQRAAKREERSQSDKAIISVGQGEDRLSLPKDCVYRIWLFLGKPEMGSVALVSYKWAKACLSPLNPYWQSIRLPDPFFIDRNGAAARESAAKCEELLSKLQRPQFALVKELDDFDCYYSLGIPHDDTEAELAMFNRISRLCPNIETLDTGVRSKVAAQLPVLFPNLTSVENVYYYGDDSASHAVQYAKAIGARLEYFSFSQDMETPGKDPFGDDCIIEIGKHCPNLRDFRIYDDESLLNGITIQGLTSLVKCCPKLEFLRVCITSGPDSPFDWRAFLQFLSKNAPSLTRLGIIDYYDHERSTEMSLTQERQMVQECFGSRFAGVGEGVDYGWYFLKTRGKRTSSAI